MGNYIDDYTFSLDIRCVVSYYRDMNNTKQEQITSLTAGQVERNDYVQPANTELRKVWSDGVYHYELRPAGYRTQYERELEAEFAAEEKGA